MSKKINPQENYESTKSAVGYVAIKDATQDIYDRLGFMSGLEVHQQLLTKEKLFCRCPAGVYHKNSDFDAEIVRHMRPTLSELGEYDGTALMEFKTKKEIVYRIKNQTTCTYEIDDTPPFRINQEAIDKAIQISLLSKLKIVGEIHITRKQYLDGSIPTGFQRTAIIGVEGEIPLKNKKVRLIQLSLEEDSCREISDIGHQRIYKTDRLGMPLIETVTYPDMKNPYEVMEAANYIRFLNRSTSNVRTGIGAGREDVNVSCKGGTRVEIKGVSHNKWIPILTHVEVFRQWALLQIKSILLNRISDVKKWKISHIILEFSQISKGYEPLLEAKSNNYKLIAINLPGFAGILSHFTQPGKVFANELSDRLKVIACLEKPNLLTSEDLNPAIQTDDFDKISQLFGANENDAQIIIWCHENDLSTAIETIEERCKMAFEGVPKETRKSFEDGTTIFERVLPGADRMYPDTDSAPIPLQNSQIEKLSKNLPSEIIERYNQLIQWQIPIDTFNYIFKKNLFQLIEKIIVDLKVNPKFVGTFFGHQMKFIEGHYSAAIDFTYQRVYDLFAFLIKSNLNLDIAKNMMAVIYMHPKMDFESVLISIKFKRQSHEEVKSRISFLKEKYNSIGYSKRPEAKHHWIMGELRKSALGNFKMSELFDEIVK